MAQTDDHESLNIAQDSDGHGLDEAITMGTSYANVLVIKPRKFRNININLRLDDAAIDGDYIIYTTAKKNPGTTVTEDHWYVEQVATAITHNIVTQDLIAYPCTAIIIQAKADSGTPTLKAWYRGMN